MKRIVAMFLLFPFLISAQTEWSRNVNRPTVVFVGVEGLFPSYNSFFFGQSSGFGIFVSGRVPLPGVAIVLELPYASSTQKFSSPFASFEFSKAGLGNPYVGVEIGSSPDFIVELGARLPLMSEEGSAAGISLSMADILTLERYLPQAMTLRAGLSVSPDFSSLLTGHLRVGPTFWIPIPREGRETEALLDYEAGLAVELGPVVAGAGVGGRMILSDDRFIGNKKAVHVFQIEVGAFFGPVHPSVYYRALLDQEVSLAVSSIIGVVVAVSL